MNTEITDTTNSEVRLSSWIGYDAHCGLCVRLAGWVRPSLEFRGFRLVPLQTPWMLAWLGLKAEGMFDEMKLILPDGRVIGGARAVVEIARQTWWLRPLHWIGSHPNGLKILDRGYRWIAGRRKCANGACVVKPDRPGAATWLPLIVLPSTAVLLKSTMPGWVFMWVLALAIFGGCKWLALKTARAAHPDSVRRRLAFMVGWPGMDATLFLDEHRHPIAPPLASFGWTAVKTVLGAALIWCGVRLIPADWQIAQGWLGMIGLVLLLHFGVFDLLAFFWRRIGVVAEPIMRKPMGSTSLTELWGWRWNSAFHQLVHRHVFRPAARRIHPQGAMWLVFLVSGVIHDLVISLPAGGGYGLPTAYFLFQALGVSIERSESGRAFGLGKNWQGWLFTMVVALAPVGWLFHREFILNVIFPFLHAMNAV